MFLIKDFTLVKLKQNPGKHLSLFLMSWSVKQLILESLYNNLNRENTSTDVNKCGSFLRNDFSIHDVYKPYKLLLLILNRKLPPSGSILIEKLFNAGFELCTCSLGCRLKPNVQAYKYTFIHSCNLNENNDYSIVLK